MWSYWSHENQQELSSLPRQQPFLRLCCYDRWTGCRGGVNDAAGWSCQSWRDKDNTWKSFPGIVRTIITPLAVYLNLLSLTAQTVEQLSIPYDHLRLDNITHSLMYIMPVWWKHSIQQFAYGLTFHSIISKSQTLFYLPQQKYISINQLHKKTFNSFSFSLDAHIHVFLPKNVCKT